MRQVLEAIGQFRYEIANNLAELLPDAFLCADVLESAGRCRARKQFNEAVLRLCRALEVAVQGALLNKWVNPWHSDWERAGDEVRGNLEGQFGRLP